MTKKKTIADSLMFMLTHPVALAISDRTRDITEAATEVESWWGYDLFKRKPGRAYYDEQGNFHMTDLDLACFMYELSKRGAIINIPYYKSMRANVKREDQQLTSKNNRHGAIIGLNSNKEFFSFSIKVIDQNVIGEEKVGDFRKFSLTDLTGEWYKGWNKIEFQPTLKENRWLHEKELFTGNHIYFKTFIAPNRWTSFFGHHYALTKMLLDRLEDESAFYNREIMAMLNEGIRFPKGDGPAPFRPYTKTPGVRKKFEAFEVKVQYPSFAGKYPVIPHDQENLIRIYKLRKYWVYTLAPRLRFMTRAAEYAHYKSPERMPFWIQNAKWETGYRLPRGRIDWTRLVLFQPEPGKPAVSLIKRQYEKSTEVAAE